jgi:hypothetical protein
MPEKGVNTPYAQHSIANIIGGSLMVRLAYWFVYILKGMVAPATSDAEGQA